MRNPLGVLRVKGRSASSGCICECSEREMTSTKMYIRRVTASLRLALFPSIPATSKTTDAHHPSPSQPPEGIPIAGERKLPRAAVTRRVLTAGASESWRARVLALSSFPAVLVCNPSPALRVRARARGVLRARYYGSAEPIRLTCVQQPASPRALALGR